MDILQLLSVQDGNVPEGQGQIKVELGKVVYSNRTKGPAPTAGKGPGEPAESCPGELILSGDTVTPGEV